MALLCDRPHARFVDFETSRFVVASSRGLDLGIVKFERGDLLPRGALDAYTLRCEYEARNVELLSFALEYDADLREAYARRNAPLEEASQPVEHKILNDSKSKHGRKLKP